MTKKVLISAVPVILLILGIGVCAVAQTSGRPATIAVLDLSSSSTGRAAAAKLAANLKNEADISVFDRDQVRAAAIGAGYDGSFNLALDDARNLGQALGSDFFVVGDAQTLRRSPSKGPVYFESYASVFLVSSRTGRLVTWERPSFEARTASEAEQALLSNLSDSNIRLRLTSALRKTQADERGERELSSDKSVPVIEEAPDDEKHAAAQGLRLPKPFRRLIPAYPETAAKAEAEATVDVLVDLDERGDVTRVEIARWAGFGLDQSTMETVRRLRFFPAMRDGVAVPMRVLLRYNFRKPPPPAAE